MRRITGAVRSSENQLLAFVARVAEWDTSVGPATFLGATLDPRGHAIDDRGVLELGEHTEHLQHHPTCR
jgi:hypothetical protein